MSDDYLWDRSGHLDPEIREIEELLAPLAHTEPMRLANELVRATAIAPPESGRTKGNMNLFDKRFFSGAAIAAGVSGLLGITVFRHTEQARPRSQYVDVHTDARTTVLTHSFAWTAPAAPAAPVTHADLAITAGESVRIHVPLGAVDVEIQSNCKADVELSAATAMVLQRATDADAAPTLVPQLPAESHAIGGDPVIPGVVSADGTTTTYHLTPELGGMIDLGIVQYTSRCAGKPTRHGAIEIDREDARRPIGAVTNARVFTDGITTKATVAHGIHVFGTVLPGATVTIGSKRIALGPVDPANSADLPIGGAFSIDVPLTLDHLVAAVRVDDAMGTHFYVIHPSLVVDACAIAPSMESAAKLDARGDHVGALATLATAMADCTPDRETLSVALSYACTAGDSDAANRYWEKLPESMRSTLRAECTRNGIKLD